MCVNETGQVRGTRTHPAGFTGLNAAGYIITWVKWILRPESHRHRLLYERSAFLALPRRNETTADRRSAPARTCTSNLRVDELRSREASPCGRPAGRRSCRFPSGKRRTATCRTLTPRELMGKTCASCRCRPGPCGLEDRHARCYINDVKWWLNSELRRTLLGFSEALISLSYSALKWSLREVTLLGLSVIG